MIHPAERQWPPPHAGSATHTPLPNSPHSYSDCASESVGETSGGQPRLHEKARNSSQSPSPLHLANLPTHRLVYLESETASMFLEKPEEIAAYRRILGLLAETALGEEEISGTDCHPGNRALRGSRGP
ncbi:MAG: Scr1 family TA system antitoxin-like transcriptional regulator [Pseudonocardiaceae bacterium]